MIRLADAMVHHSRGDRVSPDAMVATAANLGPRRGPLRELLYEYPHTAGQAAPRLGAVPALDARDRRAARASPRARSTSRSPQELSLSVSTIRTHLHNVYRKIGAVDRAQAVLIARDRGWM